MTDWVVERSMEVSRVSARTKLVVTLVVITVCVSTPPDRFVAFAGYFVLLACALAALRVPPRTVVRRLAVIAPFVLACALFIPFLPANGVAGGYSFGIGGLHVSRTGLMVFWNVLAKAGIGVLCVTLLAETTPVPALLGALERLRFPRLLVVSAGLAYRYLFVLIDEAWRMKRAHDARCFRGRWLWNAGAVGRMIGTLFLRSYERGERVYFAMASRTPDGPAAPVAGERLTGADVAFAAVTLVLFLALRVGAS